MFELLSGVLAARPSWVLREETGSGGNCVLWEAALGGPQRPRGLSAPPPSPQLRCPQRGGALLCAAWRPLHLRGLSFEASSLHPTVLFLGGS